MDKNSMVRRTNSKIVNLIGFPMDLGADRRGVDMGPSALRIAGISQQLQSLVVSTTRNETTMQLVLDTLEDIRRRLK